MPVDCGDELWEEHERLCGKRRGWRSALVPEDVGCDDDDDGWEDVSTEDPYPTAEDAISDVSDPSDVGDTQPTPQIEDTGWKDTSVDVQAMMSDVFRPGTNHITDGVRGGGKTFMAVSYAQPMVEGFFRKQGRVVLLTNIIFVRRVSKTGPKEDQFVMETPENVVHVTSMEQLFRVECDLMKRYGRENVMFLVILDEAQNFLLADEYQKGVSIPFMKFYGTTRKFNTCIWLLTPSLNNLPPRARNFLDGDPAGYVSYRWRKNKVAAAHFIKQHPDMDATPQQIAYMKAGTDIPPVKFLVKGTSWTRPLDELEIGEYGYDHLACADFAMSMSNDPEREFRFDDLMARCSDLPSFHLTKVMSEFFDEMDRGAMAPVRDNAEEQRIVIARIISKLRALDPPMSFRNIAKIVDVPEATCRSWLDRYISATDGTPSDNPGGGGGGASPPTPSGVPPEGPKRGGRK